MNLIKILNNIDQQMLAEAYKLELKLKDNSLSQHDKVKVIKLFGTNISKLSTLRSIANDYSTSCKICGGVKFYDDGEGLIISCPSCTEVDDKDDDRYDQLSFTVKDGVLEIEDR